MVNMLILDLGADILGNCAIEGFEGKIIVESYRHGVSIPLQLDPSQTERTAGRPVFSELVLTKMCDLSTPEIYKACCQGNNIPVAVLEVGRIEQGSYMSLMRYELTNAMVLNVKTSAGIATTATTGNTVPMDTFSIAFTQIKCDYTQQESDSTSKGSGTWNWNMATMRAE